MLPISGVLSQLGLAEFGSAGDVGAVHLLAQVAVVGVLHHRQVGRHVQGELPARLAIGLGRRFHHGQHVVRHAGELGGIVDIQREVVGGVEQVFLELGGQLRQFFLHLHEAGLLVGRQLGAAEAEIAQLVVDDLPARGGQRGEIGRAFSALNLANSASFCPSSA